MIWTGWLVESVTAACESFEPMKLNFSFLTLQGVLDEVIQRQDDNNYDILHIGKKAALARIQGILTEQLEANEEAIELTRIFLDEDLDEEKNMEQGMVEMLVGILIRRTGVFVSGTV